MIRNLAHVCFSVRDLKASEDFYVGKLGLKAAFDFVNERGQRFGLYIHVGGRNFIEMFEGKPVPPAAEHPFRHICLEVDDLQATVEQFRNRGVEVSDPKLGNDRSWQAWLADPDGNRIELHQYTAGSRQTPHLNAE